MDDSKDCCGTGVPLDVQPPAKVPHVGWNALRYDPDDWLFTGVPAEQTDFYFVHSFHMVCKDPADLAGKQADR